MNQWHVAYALAAFVALAFCLLGWFRFDSASVLMVEMGRYLEEALSLLDGGQLNTHGPTVVGLWFGLGPLYAFVLAPLVAFSPDPFFVRSVVIVLLAGAAVLLLGAMRRSVRPHAAVLIVLLLLCSRFSLDTISWVWHSSFLPLVACLWLLLAGRFLNEPRPWHAVALAGLLAVAVQLHILMATWLPVLAWLLFVHRRRLGWPALIVPPLVFVGIALPMLSPAIAGILDGKTFTGSAVGRAELVPTLAFVARQIAGNSFMTALVLPALVVGSVVAVRRGRYERMLFAMALLLLLPAVVSGTEYSTNRYLHPGIYAAFGLVALGLDVAMQRLSDRVSWALVAVVTVGLLVELLLRPSPKPPPDLLDGRTQQHLADAIAGLGLSGDNAQGRTHGMYDFSSGALGYLHRHNTQPAPRELPPGESILVVPASIEIAPPGEITRTVVVEGPHEPILVHAFRPGKARNLWLYNFGAEDCRVVNAQRVSSELYKDLAVYVIPLHHKGLASVRITNCPPGVRKDVF